MFFQSMNQMMSPNVDITLVIHKSADGRMAVSMLPKSNVSSMKIIKRESADYHTRVLSLSSVSLETGNKPLSHQ